ncbi:MAG: hypothetical protein C4570_06670 [Ammonifex sp.]|nr:MAG: hypothetical protein C4570_06670 [Ammonifex sp.]
MKESGLIKKSWVQAVLKLGVAMAGVVLSIWIFGPARCQIDGLTVQQAIRPAAYGHTVVEIPPLGALTAKTHASPLQYRVTLLRVEEKMVTSTITDWSLDKLWQRVEHDAQRALLGFVLRQLIAGVLGAVLLSLFLLRLAPKKVWQPAVIGLLLTGAWLAPAYATYQIRAFEHPAYSGMIAAAPRVLALSENLVTGFHRLRADTPEVLANLQNLFDRADGLNGFSGVEKGKKLLLVSDIHNNPVGLAVTRELAARFAVDAVLDAGDLTDFGSPLELNLIEDLTKIGVPYVFAPGNHDSPEVKAYLASKPGVYVLKGEVVTVAGFRVLGSPDASSYGREVGASTSAAEQSESEAQAASLASVLGHVENPVDVLLVHNPQVARTFFGRVPLIVFGHTHLTGVEGNRASLLLNPGTTGAAGIRGFRAYKEIPYTAMVVYFDDAKLTTAVDIISYGPREGNFRVERRMVAEP